MSNVDKIRSAEEQIGELQDTLAAVQAGLEQAESIAVAADDAKRRADQLLNVTLGLVGLSILLIVLSRRKPSA
jgi:multidrug resistance efflux pump